MGNVISLVVSLKEPPESTTDRSFRCICGSRWLMITGRGSKLLFSTVMPPHDLNTASGEGPNSKGESAWSGTHISSVTAVI